MHFKNFFIPFFWTLVYVFLPLFVLQFLIETIRKIPYRLSDSRARAAGFNKVDSMTGHQFEVWLAHQFRLAGYTVNRTPYRGDHGADLILIANDGTKTAVQAKKLANSKDRVGAPALGEVLRGKKFYNCSKAMVVTNQGYTQQAQDEARKMGIILVDRKRLVDFIAKVENRTDK